MSVAISVVSQSMDKSAIIAQTPYAKVPGSEATLAHFLAISISSWVAWVDGEIACVWGLVAPSVLSDRAYLWLLTTDRIEGHKFLLTRYSQRVIEIMLETYPVIIGHTAVGDDKAIRWLKWLGAVFDPAEGGKIAFTIRKR